MRRIDQYKNIGVSFLWVLCFIHLPVAVFSQAPAISYGGYKLLTRDSMIGKMRPVNLGGEVPKTSYSQTTTFAGNDLPGSSDGKGIKAAFNRPSKIAVDNLGNLYIADELNNKIRKMAPDGTVTTLAGSGKAGAENNSKGGLASFNGPGGIGVDRQGNIYVADVYNHKVRKITPAGSVSTLAGSGHQGYVDDARGLMAEFDYPVDVTVDEAGNVYVADEGNNKIRKITTSGSVSTFAGSGAVGALDNRVGVLATFNQPNGIAVDQKGNVYVADQLNHKVRKITPIGAVSTLAGNGQAGSSDNNVGILAAFNNPRGITVDRIGNVYVGDVGNQKVRKITAAGVVSTLAGSGVAGAQDNQNGSLAEFYFPDGVAIDSLGNLYVADALNNKIRKIETKGYSIIPELLPEGLHFDNTTGELSGTPAEDAINSMYTITAYNIFGSSTTHLTLGILPQPGNALSFDGTDDRVFVPDAKILRSPVVSVELWVNFKNMSAGFGRMVVKRNDLTRYDDSYSVGVDSLLHFVAGVCSGSGTVEGQRFAKQKKSFTTNTWHYVAAVFTQDSMKLYVNGLLEDAVFTGFPLKHGNNALSFGFDERMAFLLDEVRIFNTDRSVFIADDMFNVLPLETPGLVAYYNFNIGKAGGQNAGLTTVVDITGNGNNGVLTNFKLSEGNTSNWVESYAMMIPLANSAQEINSAGFTAAWNKPNLGEADLYLLDVSTNPSFLSFVPGYHDKSVINTTQIVSGLQAGTTYYYRVRAKKNVTDMESGYSKAIPVKTNF
ncbi:MAG: LamG-like jellyroll fold domain-containing protein [Sediminibacterium sp.]